MELFPDELIDCVISSLADLTQVDLEIAYLLHAAAVCSAWRIKLNTVAALLTADDFKNACVASYAGWMLPHAPRPLYSGHVVPPLPNTKGFWQYAFWHPLLASVETAGPPCKTNREWAFQLAREGYKHMAKTDVGDWVRLLSRVPLEVCCLTLVTSLMLMEEERMGRRSYPAYSSWEVREVDYVFITSIVAAMSPRRASDCVRELLRLEDTSDGYLYSVHFTEHLQCNSDYRLEVGCHCSLRRIERGAPSFCDLSDVDDCDCELCSLTACPSEIIAQIVGGSKAAIPLAPIVSGSGWTTDDKLRLVDTFLHDVQGTLTIDDMLAHVWQLGSSDDQRLEVLTRFITRENVDTWTVRDASSLPEARFLALLARLLPS